MHLFIVFIDAIEHVLAFNPIQDGPFWDCLRMGGGLKRLKSVTQYYNDETWLTYTLPKEDPKNM